MFQRLKTPAILLTANLAFVMAGCEKSANSVATTPDATTPNVTTVDTTVPDVTTVDTTTADTTTSDATTSDATTSDTTTADTTTSDASAPAMTGDAAPVIEKTGDAKTGEAKADETYVAVCRLEPIGDSGVEGTVNFSQKGDKVTVTGEVKGLEPGKHGFHVHEKGDLSDKETGKSAGGHYNPTDQKHGKPSDAERHVGDLGNITANDEGVAKIDIQDKVISLHGDHSIIGKSIVVHVGEDKFTQPTGDAGARAAFGVIEKKDKR